MEKKLDRCVKYIYKVMFIEAHHYDDLDVVKDMIKYMVMMKNYDE